MARFLHGGAFQTFSVALQPEWDIDFWWRSQDVHLVPPGELRRFQLLLGLEWCHDEMKETDRFSSVRPSSLMLSSSFLEHLRSSPPSQMEYRLGFRGAVGPDPAAAPVSAPRLVCGVELSFSPEETRFFSPQKNNPLHSPRVPFPHNMDASTSLLTQTLLWKCESVKHQHWVQKLHCFWSSSPSVSTVTALQSSASGHRQRDTIFIHKKKKTAGILCWKSSPNYSWTL